PRRLGGGIGTVLGDQASGLGSGEGGSVLGDAAFLRGRQAVVRAARREAGRDWPAPGSGFWRGRWLGHRFHNSRVRAVLDPRKLGAARSVWPAAFADLLWSFGWAGEQPDLETAGAVVPSGRRDSSEKPTSLGRPKQYPRPARAHLVGAGV